MLLTITKKCSWKETYINILDENYTLIRKEKLVFKDKITTVNFNLNNDKFYYLSNEKEYKTEIVIISENTDEVYLEYNRKKRKYYIYLADKNNYYAEALSVILEDDKNLWFRPNKAKKVDFIIPKNYDVNKKYGLLLMFDGQNLFDKNISGNYTDKNDPYGSWQIDISMSMLEKKLGKEFIVVGIEHTDILRTNELLTPKSFGNLKDESLLDDNEKEGYIDYLDNFINETVLPYFINNYSIDLSMIGIGGSSMGGLGCHYIGLKNLGKYKFILCYTPASALIEDIAWDKFYKKLDFKNNITSLPIFYFFQGNSGWLENMLYTNNQNLISTLIDNNYPKELIKTYIEHSANHNEIAWRYAFNYMIYDVLK